MKTRIAFTLTIIVALVSAVAPGTSARELTIEQFLTLVEKESQDLKLAEQDVKAAGAEQRQATSAALPHVGAQAGYERDLRDTYMYLNLGALTGENQEARIVANYDNNYSAGVSLQQVLFNGQVFNGIKAARQYRRLTDLSFDATYQGVITGAKQAFRAAQLLKAVRDVARDAEQNALENYDNVKNAYDHGLASEFDMLQAEVRYKDAVPQTTAAQRDYEISLVTLKNLAGLPVDDDIEPAGKLEDYPGLPEPLGMEHILEARPDYQALQWEEKLRKTGVRAEQSAYLPTLAGVFAYGYSAQSNEWSFDRENNSLTVGVTLSMPIFMGGETRAKVQKARVELEKVRIRTEQSRRSIAREVKNSRLTMEEAYGRIDAAQATVRAAEKAYAIAETTARNGLTTQLQLKDSRVALDRASVAYYSAIYEYLSAQYEWERVIGKAQGAVTK